MTLQRLLSCISAGRNLGGGEWESRQSVQMRAGCEYIDLIVLRLSRRSRLCFDKSVAQDVPNLSQLLKEPQPISPRESK